MPRYSTVVHLHQGKATYTSKGLQIADLAILDMKETTPPYCEIQHKVLEILPQYDIAS